MHAKTRCNVLPKSITQRKKYSELTLYKVFHTVVPSCNHFETHFTVEKHTLPIQPSKEKFSLKERKEEEENKRKEKEW